MIFICLFFKHFDKLGFIYVDITLSPDGFEVRITVRQPFEFFMKNFSKIAENYQLIPSTEIWTTNTIEPILKMLSYHHEMRHFNDKKSAVLIIEQLNSLMNTLQNWIKKGTKGTRDTPFKFYISDIDIGNTFIIMKRDEQYDCLIRLFTTNGLSISDRKFCREVERWLANLAKRATLISGASEKEGFKFFEDQKKKIELLRESFR